MKRTMLTMVGPMALLAFVGLASQESGAQAQSKDKAAAPAAPAAAASSPSPAGGGNTVQYKQKTVYDFDDDTVEGDLVRPDGELVDSRRGAKHSSLIKIRENFIPEMLKSVEAI